MGTKKLIKSVLLAALVGCLSVGCLSNRETGVKRIHVASENVYEQAAEGVVSICIAGSVRGTGFVVQGKDATYIWTAAHVIVQNMGDKEPLADLKIGMRVEVDDMLIGHSFVAVTLVKMDPVRDIALVKCDLQLKMLRGLNFSRRVNYPIGTPLFHIGNHDGKTFEKSLVTGVLAKKARRIRQVWTYPLDQLDMTVIPGCSGGPVFNSKGEVVGIVVGAYPPTSRPGLMVPVRDIILWAGNHDLTFALESK